MWRLVTVGVLVLAFLVVVVAMSGCAKSGSGHRMTSGEKIQQEMQEKLGTTPGALPPPPPAPASKPEEPKPAEDKPAGD